MLSKGLVAVQCVQVLVIQGGGDGNNCPKGLIVATSSIGGTDIFWNSAFI